ncbi:ABC transporter ATP-binding protein [Sporomusa termitida]|uniref:Oligopeptide transport ATP-binding protein OppD n=1 Tax=Sporomusa termitida TaxID=2377 RepID=A0A517DV30_9FIRM|nr:ABC transporter ATP-binding protein [Sporomusa termitida]QDR81212.1 Oligopeptide transport ATP-binding protein OppD [Sporomusa termitida]
MAAKLLEIKDLHIGYFTEKENVKAVNGISFDLNQEETIGLVGETGAGKTTTALGIMQLLPERTGKITGGSILLKGENLLGISKNDMRLNRGSKISMIFQDPMTSLNPTMTVGQQIRESLDIHNKGQKKAELEKRVDKLLELVGIPAGRKYDYPHQFSGGMKQRVVISIALACEPELLIADEPTTALDVTIQAQVLALMESLKKELKTSIIIITHDLGVVAEICDKVAIMYAGEIVEQGTAGDIFAGKSHHPYTIGLFASIPDLTKDTKRLQPIEGLMPDAANLPAGCKFHPRCKCSMEKCKTEAPYRYEQDGHVIACHLLKQE